MLMLPIVKQYTARGDEYANRAKEAGERGNSAEFARLMNLANDQYTSAEQYALASVNALLI